MARHGITVGSRWPTDKSDYAYLLDLAYPAWAWEYLRRTPAYARDVHVHGYVTAWQHPGAPALSLTRAHRRSLAAEKWQLDCFRRSATESASRTSRLAVRTEYDADPCRR